MIRPSIVLAVVRRELLEIVRNRVLLTAVVLPPVLLVALPVIITSTSHPKPLAPEVVANLIAARPAWAGLRPDQLVAA
jgi:ABC-type Na+ efflux pump permease subunit